MPESAADCLPTDKKVSDNRKKLNMKSILAKLPTPQRIFQKSLHLIVNILIIYIILILFIGLVKTVVEFKTLLSSNPIKPAFSNVITDILAFLVIIELFKGFIEFLTSCRFSLHSMIDPAIMFVLRELIIHIYQKPEVSFQTLSGFALVIMALGAVRTLAICFSPELCKDAPEPVID